MYEMSLSPNDRYLNTENTLKREKERIFPLRIMHSLRKPSDNLLIYLKTPSKNASCMCAHTRIMIVG